MKEFKEILEKICKKVGAEFRFIHYKGTGTGNEMWLRGWLLHPDTAKAIWGVEDACPDCGDIFKKIDHPRYGEMFECKCILQKQIFPIEAWRYHNAIVANMQSNSEILTYMKGYL